MRICTLDIPVFRDGGLVVTPSWSKYEEPKDPKARAKMRASLVRHHGRFIRIHPEDLPKIRDLGFALKGDELVDLTDKKPQPNGEVDKTKAKTGGGRPNGEDDKTKS